MAHCKLKYLHRLRRVAPRTVLGDLYISTILPILKYGNNLFDNCTLATSNMLQNIQRKPGVVLEYVYRLFQDGGR